MYSDLDNVFFILGSPGRYQLLVGFLVCCLQLPAYFTDILLEVFSITPPHRCRVTSGENRTFGESELRPLIEINDKKLFASCSRYVDPSDKSLGTERCLEGWEFLIPQNDWSVTVEWELVCEREFLIRLLPYIYNSVAIIGCTLIGCLADRYGRKLILLFITFFHSAFSIALYFPPNYVSFATLYTIDGVFALSIQCISFILLLEILPTPYQWKAAAWLSAIRPFSLLTSSLLAWLIRHWRYIQLAVAVLAIVPLAFFWLIPRSLHWLVSENKLSDAENEVERIAQFNSISVRPSFRLQLQNAYNVIRSSGGASSSRHSLEVIFCAKRLRRYTFIQYYIWFSMAMISQVTIDDVPALKERKYLNLFVEGLIGLGMVIFIYFLVERMGCKLIQGFLLIGSGVLCIASAILRHYIEPMKDTDKLSMAHIPAVFGLLGKNAICATFTCAFFLAAQMLPTGIRVLGLCICVLWSKVAILVIPHLSSLGSDEMNFLPLSLTGAMVLIAGILTFLLPNCWRRPLPMVAEEAEEEVNHFEIKGKSVYIPPMPPTDIISGEDTLKTISDSIDFHKGTRTRTECFSQEDGVDNESRLTDLEEELTKIWEQNTHHYCRDSNNPHGRDLYVFYHSDSTKGRNMRETGL